MNTTLIITRSIAKLTLVIFVMMQLSCGGTTTSSTDVVSASAGDDSDVLVGTEVTLDGGASTGVTTVEWTLTSTPSGAGAELLTPTTTEATFTPDVVGDYVAQVSINDGASTDEVTITARNVVAGIGASTGVSAGTRFSTATNFVNLEQTGVVLTASPSQVAEGASIATYLWEQIDGPSATATAGTDGETFEFTAPALTDLQSDPDTYRWGVLPISRDDRKMTFKLTITDGDGNSDVSTTDIYLADNGSEIVTSSGLYNVGVGTRVYLNGPSLKAVSSAASTAVTDWRWVLVAPLDSGVTFVNSGSTLSTIQMPSFVPTVAGTYTISYTSTSGGVTTAQSIVVTASTYVGVGTVGGTTAVSPQCGNCHDGSVQPDNMTGYLTTVHSDIFENNISSYSSLAPTPYLWEYHTVGYNEGADNDGFDDLASEAVFEFPEDGLTFADFIADDADVAVLANVQCESCHGPGGDHNGSPTKIDYSTSMTGVCGQCHQQEDSWANSAHNSLGVVHGSGSYQSSWLGSGCNRCHTGRGFMEYVAAIEDEDSTEEAAITAQASITSTTETGAFVGIQCAGCHDPHSNAKERQLRRVGVIRMLVDDSDVDAGVAATCYTCHDGVYSYGKVNCDDNNDGTSEATCLTTDQIAIGVSRQVHYNPQAPVFEGKGGLTDIDGDGDNEFVLDEDSFHTSEDFILSEVTGDDTLSTTNDKCVTCHMAQGPTSEEEGYKHLGGHAFKLRSGHSIGHLTSDEEDGEEEEEASGDIELVSACQSCHLDVEDTFDREARADYDGDGTIEGIQSEVTGLLYALTTKIIANDGGDVILTTSGTTLASGEYTVDALSYSSTSSATKGWRIATDTIRRATWNHNLIVRDASLGVHNAAFTVQLLQGTYSAVGGNTFATDYPLATIR